MYGCCISKKLLSCLNDSKPSFELFIRGYIYFSPLLSPATSSHLFLRRRLQRLLRPELQSGPLYSDASLGSADWLLEAPSSIGLALTWSSGASLCCSCRALACFSLIPYVSEFPIRYRRMETSRLRLFGDYDGVQSALGICPSKVLT